MDENHNELITRGDALALDEPPASVVWLMGGDTEKPKGSPNIVFRNIRSGFTLYRKTYLRLLLTT